MSALFLLIPDPVLREAVIEQIKAAKLGDACLLAQPEDLSERIKDKEPPHIIVVDKPQSQEKAATLARALCEKAERPILLGLGYDADADNVTESFPKPFRLGHLVSRLKHYLETASLIRDNVLTFGPFRLEPLNRRISRDDDAPMRLTEKETALLAFLAQNKGPATRQDILASVWGYGERIDTHTLETHIYQLRKKLDKEGENWLISDQGSYRLMGAE